MNTRRSGWFSCVLTLVAGIAIAALLPDPPFSGGGFNAPTAIVLKQEIKVDKIIGKYMKNRVTCDQKALNGLQLAYEPANPTKIQELQDAWGVCISTALARYAANRDRQLLLGTPSCLDQAAIDVIRQAAEAQLALDIPTLYCDGDAAAPDPVTGLNIPDFNNEADGERKARNVVLKAGLKTSKCYEKAATLVFTFGGTLPADMLAKVLLCLQKVSDTANAAMVTLDQRQKLPACLPVGTAQGVAASAIAAASNFTGVIYCASPSGAFLD